jgi:aldose 1-epimerase
MRLGRRAAAKAALLSRRNFGAQWKHMSQSESIGVVDGRETRAFTITNGKGLTARIMELGATLLEFHAPDRRGQLADIALGEQGLAAYLVSHSYFGAICGRYGNRIGRGRLILDGKAHQLSCNEGRNHLHGGFRGFDKHLWSGRPAADGRSVAFSYRSADGEEGFPGNLDAAVVYSLDEEDRFILEIEAETDRPTVCNLVHHGYWNLAGHGAGEVLDHELAIEADFYAPGDGELIPTGEIRSVEGTPMDFRAAKPIGRDIARVERIIGYDHSFVLRGAAGELKRAARLFHPASGRGFELHTTEPGVQLYTAGHFDGRAMGKGGQAYPRFGGVALETQHFPDAPNKGHFLTTRLDPGQRYRHRMEFRFFMER